MSNPIEVRVPDIGDFTDVPVIEISVAPGDIVEEGDTLLSLESDKATLDVPAEMAGRIVELKVEVDDKVSQGSIILTMETVEGAETPPALPPDPAPVAPDPITAPSPAPSPTTANDPIPPVANDPGAFVHASPSVRRYARQLGVVVSEVPATGRKGRTTREDIESFVKARLTASVSAGGGNAPAPIAGLPDWPKVDFAKFGPVERVELSRIAKISGPALARNAMVIPHVTNFEKADVTDLEAFRKTMNAEAGPEGTRLTMLAFAVKAVVSALQTYPKFNASLDGDALIVKSYWNIGVAADTPEGLVVPVVREADRKGLHAIAAEMRELAGAARAGRLKSADMQGATFTISSLGGIGGTNFTPIINAPEVAILGMPRSEMQPVWDGTSFQPRLIQPLGLSFDHRVVDGVAAAHFLAHIARVLGDFRRISL